MANFAPKLTPKTDSSEEMSSYLEDIDSKFSDYLKKSKTSQKNKYFDTEQEMSALKKSIASFIEVIQHGINTTGLEGKNLEKYIDTQLKLRKKENQFLKKSIEETRESILKKKQLSDLDIKSLSELDTLEKNFKEPIEDPLAKLKESVMKFTSTLDNGIDISGLSAKDRKAYLKKQNKLSKQEAENLKKSIKSTRESILSKDVLTEEDKQSLKELNGIQQSLVKYGVKQDSIFKELKENIAGPLKQGFGTMAKDISTGLLGPLNLVTQPIEELFGFKFIDAIGGLLGKGKDKFFEKGKKVRPRLSDIKKSNPEIVWLANQLDGKGKDEEENKKGGFLDNLFGADLAKSLLPLIAKGASVAAIAAGVVMATLDGIAAVGKAQEWGVDKSSAFIGGFLGGTGEGFKNAFKKAGEFALIGAGTGFLAGGPVGAIIGGLVGAAVGGILGYIGGEKIAQAVQGLKNWFGKFIESDFIQGMKNFFVATFSNIFDLFKESFKTIGDVLVGNKTFTQGILDLGTSIFKFIGNQVQIFFNKNPLGQVISKYIINPIADFFSGIGDMFSFFASQPLDKLIISVAKGEISQEITKFKKSAQKQRFEQEMRSSIDFQNWSKSNQKTIQASDDGGKKKFLESKEGQTFLKNYKDSHLDPIPTDWVQDAIIHPSGKIIRPSPEDTIIATKSPVTGFDSANMAMNLDQLSKSITDSSKGNEIVEALEQLIDIIKDKPFNNIIQNKEESSIDFNKLRMAF